MRTQRRAVEDAETMQSALERQKIRLVREEGAVRQLWKDAPKNCEVVAPGPNGKWGYLFKVKEDLKKNGFHNSIGKTSSGTARLWLLKRRPVSRHSTSEASFQKARVKL
jgi:hypothetical protein